MRLIRDAQLEVLSHAFDIQKQALDLKHDQEIAAQRTEWSALSVERKRLWQEWEQEFGPRQRQTQGTSGRGSGDQPHSPARPRRTFAEQDAVKTKPDIESPVKRKFEDKAAAERKADGSYKPRQRPPKPRM